MARDSPAPGEKLRIQAAVALAGSNPVDTVCALFMSGALPVALRDKVVLHLGEDVTVAVVVKTAMLVKSALAVRVAVNVDKVAEEEEVTAAAVAPVPKPRGSVGTHLRKTPLVVPQSRSARSGSRCFVCDSLGHLHRDCPVKCYGCGEVEHLCKDCPRLTLNESRGPQAGPVVPKV